ncbi:MAG: DUF2917 domain-containing protein [Burkholderiales bacterium]|nr:DUF2917 domain-containing protein [Burkholderiales bacterium]
MQFEIGSTGMLQLQLAQGQLITAPRLQGLAVEALSGSLWITFEARGEDHVLRPGERIELGAGGKAVLEALEPTRLALTAPRIGGADSSVVRTAARRVLRKLGTCFGDLPVCTRNWVQTQSAHRFSLETL